MKFYKACLLTDLLFINGQYHPGGSDEYIPGTMTNKYSEAALWHERIRSTKTKGIHRNIKHGRSVIIEVEYDESTLLDHCEFQRSGVKEHDRLNCWTSSQKQKAQINTVVKYRIMSDEEVNNRIR